MLNNIDKIAITNITNVDLSKSSDFDQAMNGAKNVEHLALLPAYVIPAVIRAAISSLPLSGVTAIGSAAILSKGCEKYNEYDQERYDSGYAEGLGLKITDDKVIKDLSESDEPNIKGLADGIKAQKKTKKNKTNP